MPLITSLCILLASAHLLGRVSVRLKQPALAGHMLAGILLGPSLLAWIKPSDTLAVASDVSVLFVVLTAGLEMQLHHVVDVFRGRGAVAMLLGFIVPAALGAGVALAFSYPPLPTAVVGLCVAVTALPIALQILSSFGMLSTRIAHVAIASALLADILVFMILGILMQVTRIDAARDTLASVGLACAKVIGLFAVVIVAHWLCRHAIRLRRTRAETGADAVSLTFAILFVLVLGTMSELLGFHFAIGAFFAAMMITPEVIGTQSFARLEDTCESLSASLFGPLFLAYQGLQFHLQTLSQPTFVIVLTIVAIVGKLLSGFVVGRLQRMSNRDAWGVGIVMNARGVMELVAASIAYRAGLIDVEIYSVLLALGLVTTALTPLLLQRWQAKGEDTVESAHTS